MLLIYVVDVTDSPAEYVLFVLDELAAQPYKLQPFETYSGILEVVNVVKLCPYVLDCGAKAVEPPALR